MNSITRKTLEKHIDLIVEDFKFLKRKKEHPLECPCYLTKPCHLDIPDSDLNCFFCLCPNYLHTLPEGGCKINSSKGKWFYHESHKTARIWDCSDCDYPHKSDNVRKELRKLWGLDS